MSSFKVPDELVTILTNAAVDTLTDWLKNRRRTRMVDPEEIRESLRKRLRDSGVLETPDELVARGAASVSGEDKED